MRAVIMGCGRVGSRLAKLLTRHGLEVSVIDENSDAFRRLDPAIDVLTVTGTAIDEDVQRAAGIEGATVFAAVTNRDNSNLMAAQIARDVFKVPVVLVRIYDPVRGDIYRALGLETISPTTIIADLFYERIIKKLADQQPAQASAMVQPAPAAAQPTPPAPQPTSQPSPTMTQPAQPAAQTMQPAMQPGGIDPTKGGDR
jgi:trk system potassium uptake protein